MGPPQTYIEETCLFMTKCTENQRCK